MSAAALDPTTDPDPASPPPAGPLPPPPPVPPWLEPLLQAPYFTPCHDHGPLSRTERNMFCLNCPSDSAFCAQCKAARHAGHRTVQIRRSSYHEVVRLSEIQADLDVRGVQTYTINGSGVLFLNDRPQQTKAAGGAGRVGTTCVVCGRALLDTPFRYCSLGCKLESIRRGGRGSLVPPEGGGSGSEGFGPDDPDGPTSAAAAAGAAYGSRRWRRRGRPAGPVLSARSRIGGAASAAPGGDSPEAGRPGPQQEGDGTSSETASGIYGRHGSRRRKGIPHRAST